MDLESTRLAPRAGGARPRPRRPRRDAARQPAPSRSCRFFAALKLGAIQVPINTAYKGEFLRHQLVDSGAQGVHRAGRLRVACRRDRRRREHADAHALHHRSIRPMRSSTPCPRSGGRTPSRAARRARSTSRTCARATSRASSTPRARPGPSKGCMLPHNYIVSLADQIARALAARPPTTSCSRRCRCSTSTRSRCASSARCSIGGQRGDRAAVLGEQLLARDASAPARRWCRCSARSRSSIANADDHPDQTGHQLRLCAAAPMPPDTDRVWQERFGCKTFSGGLRPHRGVARLDARRGRAEQARARRASRTCTSSTCASSTTTTTRSRSARSARSCAGPTGPNLMFAGYWNRPEATVEATRNLWFHTGDLGRLDEDGFIYFVDRKKDALRRRGENISSFEMEKVLFGHAAIARRRGARGPEPARRGRREGHRGAPGRRAAHRGGAVPVDGRAGARTSRSRATSSSVTTCRATPSAGCSSTSSATKASPRRPGTAKPRAGPGIRTPLAKAPLPVWSVTTSACRAVD